MADNDTYNIIGGVQGAVGPGVVFKGSIVSTGTNEAQAAPRMAQEHCPSSVITGARIKRDTCDALDTCMPLVTIHGGVHGAIGRDTTGRVLEVPPPDPAQVQTIETTIKGLSVRITGVPTCVPRRVSPQNVMLGEACITPAGVVFGRGRIIDAFNVAILVNKHLEMNYDVFLGICKSQDQ